MSIRNRVPVRIRNNTGIRALRCSGRPVVKLECTHIKGGIPNYFFRGSLDGLILIFYNRINFFISY